MKKILMLSILSIFLFLVLTGSVNAFEFDNVKSYDSANRVATYKNIFGLGQDIASVKHLNPQSSVLILNDGDSCESYEGGFGYNCRVAEFQINLGIEKYNGFLKNIEWLDLNNNLRERDYSFSLRERVKKGSEEVDVFDWICSDNIANNSESCEYVKIGTKEKPIYEWKPVDNSLIQGEKVVGVYVNKVMSGEKIEFIPTFFGVETPEWADFSTYTRYEFHYTTDTPANIVKPANYYRGQTFKIGITGANESFTVMGIEFITGLFDEGGAGTEYLRIREVNSTLDPIGQDIANVTLEGNLPDAAGSNMNVSLNTTGTLNAGGNYMFFAEDDGLKLITAVDTGAGYSGGTARKNTGTWASEAFDFSFGIWGTPLVISPIVNVNSPINNTVTASSDINFNWSASIATGNLQNTTIYIQNVENYTVDLGGLVSETTQNRSLTLGEGIYNWSVDSYGDSGISGTNGSNILTIDLTSPVITIDNPQNASEYITDNSVANVTINVTIEDNIGLNLCWYFNGTGNTTITCGNNVTSEFPSGWNTVLFYANDTAGNLNFEPITFLINSVSESLNSTPTVIEGDTAIVFFNVTAGSISSITANLTYNNTVYEMLGGAVNSTLGMFNYTITAPLVKADTSVNYWVNYTLNNVSGETNVNSQLVYNVTNLVVQQAACSPTAYKFTLQDEQNFTNLNGTLEYNFAYGTSENNTFSKVYGQITNTNVLYVCFNDTMSSDWQLGEGEIFYRDNGYVDRRYYIFSGSALSSDTTNITLYDLETSVQTSFKLEVEDTSLNPYKENFTTLIRWYPELNSYKVVGMSKTDEKGDTVLHVRTEDVDYRVGIYNQNGTLIKIEDPTRFVCLVDPCTYTLKISPTDQDFTSFLNVDYTLTYNYTTGIWRFVYSDSTQKTSEMNLTIYKVSGTRVYSICSDVVSGYSGAITCNTSLYSGRLRGVVVRSASPGIPIAQKIIDTATTAFSSTFGLFISLIIGIPIIFVFAMMSPIAAIVGGIIALIPAFYLGAINLAILGGIAVLGGIVMHFLKRIG